MKRKDMSWKQFETACKRRGIASGRDSYLGYCVMNTYGHGQRLVSRLNGGETLREQLAYLIKKQSKIDDELKGTNNER